MVNRKQFPLMPLESVSLYSLQGTTAETMLGGDEMVNRLCDVVAAEVIRPAEIY